MSWHRFDLQTICTGNICRSPMAAIVLAAQFAEAGLADQVAVSSSGVSSEEAGNGIDRRAAQALTRRGYEVDARHRAHRITSGEIAAADLLLPQAYGHYLALERRGATADQLRMMRQFDPAFANREPSYDLDIDDPWYGGPADFEIALDSIEAAAPGVVKYVGGLL
ncbi:MAG: low molecular weight phosphotyrosine protein phosphatase [Bifidobacteriaceae bacterium]|jgi:protein-tyrosine phosphatase|nr:low molecular weight phosphotyrosine protein phosphatase [Bifidobacteriaceae bacterium]